MTILLPLAPGLPLALAAAALLPALAPRALALLPWAPLPALVLAVAPGEPAASYAWLVLGTELTVDGAETRLFLLAAATLWLAAGVYARSYLAADPLRRRFAVLFLLATAGNLGLVVAADAVTFYLGFALMTFSAYGLVVHERTREAWRAGRFYVVLAVVGEALLLGGILLAAFAAETISLAEIGPAVAGAPARDLAVALLLAGFAVKAGVLPLHAWLPLAHPVAPTPASAVLSGAMIKAGLLGWLRFLPLGEAELAGWGALCLAVGLATAFYGVAAGLAQRDPKTILAYSSVSQMGIVLAGLGAALAAPGAAPLVTAALAYYALHHGLAKGALFLGVGVAAAGPGRPRLVLAGQGLCALALAGAPLTSGAVAKGALDEPVGLLAWGWPEALLPLTAVGTSLLLGRFLVLAHLRPAATRTGEGPARGVWIPWAALVAAVAASAWAAPAAAALEGVVPYRPSVAGVLAGAWPVALAILVLAAAARLGRGRALPALPAGDLGVPAARGLAALRDGARGGLRGVAVAAGAATRAAIGAAAARRPGRALAAGEARLVELSTAGVALLALALALLALLAARGGG